MLGVLLGLLVVFGLLAAALNGDLATELGSPGETVFLGLAIVVGGWLLGFVFIRTVGMAAFGLVIGGIIAAAIAPFTGQLAHVPCLLSIAVAGVLLQHLQKRRMDPPSMRRRTPGARVPERLISSAGVLAPLIGPQQEGVVALTTTGPAFVSQSDVHHYAWSEVDSFEWSPPQELLVNIGLPSKHTLAVDTEDETWRFLLSQHGVQQVTVTSASDEQPDGDPNQSQLFDDK